LSQEVTVRPHAPGELLETVWVKDFVSFRFSERLPESIERTTVNLGDGRAPDAVQTGEGGVQMLLRFDPPPAEGDTVYWKGLRDAEATPLAVDRGVVPARPQSAPDLFLTDWEAVTTSRAVLRFSRPIDADDAVQTSNYRVDPEGEVVNAEFDPTRPDEVVLDVTGRALGPTGLRTSIVVLAMSAEDGGDLASEGNVATFVSSANSLAEAYVFPNPYRSSEHGASVMIAGLPNRSTIEIFSATGEQIRSLEERDGDGGVAWDLTNERGASVTSGIYIIRIETESEESIILKSAVIR
jgi:hypothetical protein